MKTWILALTLLLSSSVTKLDMIYNNYKIFQPIISKEAKRYQLDSFLIMAIITKESSWNIYAENNGCIGLMQVQNGDYEPKNNIKQGCKILNNCLNKSNGSIDLALIYYNCGYGRATKLGIKKSKYSRSIIVLAYEIKQYFLQKQIANFIDSVKAGYYNKRKG